MRPVSAQCETRKSGFESPNSSSHKEQELSSLLRLLSVQNRKTRPLSTPQNDREVLVRLSHHIAEILEHSVIVNDQNEPLIRLLKYKRDEALTPVSAFYSLGRCQFQLQKYLLHVMEETDCSISVYVLALIYMLRAQKASVFFTICSMNVHRMFAACLILAAKYLEFAVMTNKDVGTVCGLSCAAETNLLEIVMLQTLNYNLKCDPAPFRFVFRSVFNDIEY